MIFVNGYPRDPGATDMMDSARLIGMLALFNHPTADTRLISQYVLPFGEVVRCPMREHETDWSENGDNCTRDQIICLTAGLYAKDLIGLTLNIHNKAERSNWRSQNIDADKPGSRKKFPDGPDWYSPAHRNHLRICADKKPSLTGKAWLWADISYACYVDPWHEPNQLICMMVVAGPKYVQWWKAHHPDWKRSLRKYWCEEDGAWRGQKVVCDYFIAALETM
jgi:hypothetical protein